MKRNMSNLDRIIRLIVAVIFIALYFGGIVTGTLGIILLVLAGIFIMTSIVSFCPLYAVFKLSTYKSK